MSTPTSEEFYAAYWASQPPAVQSLQTIRNPQQRTMQAYTLAFSGYIIDVPIMVQSWGPLETMQIRQDAGMTWVPSGLQKPLGDVPGYTLPGIPPLNGQTPYPSVAPYPPGSITVSTNIADYPPWKPPTV